MTEQQPKLGLIAGGGDLPLIIASGAEAAGQEVFVLGVKGFVEEQVLEGREHLVMSIGETGGQIKALKRANVDQICFAGIVKRPDFKSLKLDAKGLSILPKVIAAAAKGDDSLLRCILSVFEKEGFTVVGAEGVLESLVANEGPLTDAMPTDEEYSDLQKAAYIASEVGRLDIGQGAICCRGLILAVEAQEGTDEMLKRCAALPEQLRGTSKKRSGVLVKRPKPQQERRIDLPTIGVATVKQAASAGLAGIGVEAGAALILNQDEVKAEAARAGLWIYAFSSEDLSEKGAP